MQEALRPLSLFVQFPSQLRKLMQLGLASALANARKQMEIRRAEAEDISKQDAVEGADAEALRPLSLFA